MLGWERNLSSRLEQLKNLNPIWRTLKSSIATTIGRKHLSKGKSKEL